MNADFCLGFSKEAGLATGLRSGGRMVMRGAGKVMRGIGRGGEAIGRAVGNVVGGGLAAPAAAVGKTMEVSGKAVRRIENRVAGARMGAAKGGIGLRRELRTGAGARAAAAPGAAPAVIAAPTAPTHQLGAALRAHGVQTKSLAKAREEASAATGSAKRWRAGAMVAAGGAAAFGFAGGMRRPATEEASYTQN